MQFDWQELWPSGIGVLLHMEHSLKMHRTDYPSVTLLGQWIHPKYVAVTLAASKQDRWPHRQGPQPWLQAGHLACTTTKCFTSSREKRGKPGLSLHSLAERGPPPHCCTEPFLLSWEVQAKLQQV